MIGVGEPSGVHGCNDQCGRRVARRSLGGAHALGPLCSSALDALLVEIAVPENEHPSVQPMLAGGAPPPTARPSTVTRLKGTLTSEVATTGQLRVCRDAAKAARASCFHDGGC